MRLIGFIILSTALHGLVLLVLLPLSADYLLRGIDVRDLVQPQNTPFAQASATPLVYETIPEELEPEQLPPELATKEEQPLDAAVPRFGRRLAAETPKESAPAQPEHEAQQSSNNGHTRKKQSSPRAAAPPPAEPSEPPPPEESPVTPSAMNDTPPDPSIAAAPPVLHPSPGESTAQHAAGGGGAGNSASSGGDGAAQQSGSPRGSALGHGADDDGTAWLSYKAEIEAVLQRAKHYPRIAKRARQEGRVVLEVVIDGNGNILSVNVSDSSGYPLLDEAAQRSIEAIGKLPSPPRELTWERKVLHVPYLFRLT